MTERIIITITSAQHRELRRLRVFDGNMVIEQTHDDDLDVAFSQDGVLHRLVIKPDGTILTVA